MAPPHHGNMRGCQTYIHHVHIADGFADDCEELIHRWLKTETLTYETFCEIWKDMQFNFLYHGRASGAEMAELSEELLQIAKHYLVSNTDNFEESVAGLFLVYAILRLQPYPRFAPLRLTPADAPALQRVEMRARLERRYDVLYILGSILIEGPVQFHVANRERGMESSIRKYLEGTTGIDRVGVRPKGVFYRQNEESDLLRELNSITKRYVEAKKTLGGEKCLGMNYTSEKLATELESSLKEMINGIVDDGPEATQKLQDHYSKVQEIKQKAMRRAVDGVKHLSTVSDQPSSSQVGNLRRSSRKHSQVSPKKSPSKRSSAHPSAGPSKRPRRFSSSSDSDLSMSNDSDSDRSDGSQAVDDVIRRVEVPGDLNLEEFSKEKDVQLEEKEINIEIDSLPVFIRTEQDGQMYEIEVIDKLGAKSVKEEVKKETVLKTLTEVSIEKMEAGEGTSGEQKLKEEMPVVKKREKRELKKTVLKSKFKRMGMLPMANFSTETKRTSPRQRNKK